MPDPFARAEGEMGQDFGAQARGERAGQLSLFSCPNCGGAMRQTEEIRIAEVLCHVGHAFEGEALLKVQPETIETTGWNLVRALKERATLASELAVLARDRADAAALARMVAVAEETQRQASVVEAGLLKPARQRRKPARLAHVAASQR